MVSTRAFIPLTVATEALPLSYNTEENNDACSRLWKVYVDEAERYDKALIMSWKDDMDVILVFSGLYSAILTAFIIEGYTKLQRDSGDTSVALLSQISKQLITAPTNDSYDTQGLDPFEVPASAFACNILWFLALSLSLAVAFLASLVQQWSRKFLHKTGMRPSPVIRARIFSFLYFGLRDFHMHTLVDLIPFLLHVSLFLFLGGLVAFLLQVNIILSVIMGLVLGILLGIYLLLTLHPLQNPSSPYQTPLSSALLISRNFMLGKSTSDKSLTQAMLNEAKTDTTTRDRNALQWALCSLTDETELLPFVEAIPDVIYGERGLRMDNVMSLIPPLLSNSDRHQSIIQRIEELIRHAGGKWFNETQRRICHLAGPKALWALAHALYEVGDDSSLCLNFPPLWFTLTSVAVISDGLRDKTLEPKYAVPALALVRVSRMQCFLAVLRRVGQAEDMSPCEVIHYKDVLSSFQADDYLPSQAKQCIAGLRVLLAHYSVADSIVQRKVYADMLLRFHNSTRLRILHDLLQGTCEANELSSYELFTTCRYILQFGERKPYSPSPTELFRLLSTPLNLPELDVCKIFSIALSLIGPTTNSACMDWVYKFLAANHSQSIAILQAYQCHEFQGGIDRFRDAVAVNLRIGVSDQEACLSAIWNMHNTMHRVPNVWSIEDTSIFWADVSHSLRTASWRRYTAIPTYPSVMALAKCLALRNLDRVVYNVRRQVLERLGGEKDPWTEPDLSLLPLAKNMHISTVFEFLSACAKDPTPGRAVETMEMLVEGWIELVEFPEAVQLPSFIELSDENKVALVQHVYDIVKRAMVVPDPKELQDVIQQACRICKASAVWYHSTSLGILREIFTLYKLLYGLDEHDGYPVANLEKTIQLSPS